MDRAGKQKAKPFEIVILLACFENPLRNP